MPRRSILYTKERRENKGFIDKKKRKDAWELPGILFYSAVFVAVFFLLPNYSVFAEDLMNRPWSIDKEGIGAQVLVPKRETSIPKIPFLATIKFYQKIISPIGGNRCQMYPSCSQYSYLSFQKHGVVLGYIMTTDRLMRDNPGASEYYQSIFKNGRYWLYDPIEENDFWIR